MNPMIRGGQILPLGNAENMTHLLQALKTAGAPSTCLLPPASCLLPPASWPPSESQPTTGTMLEERYTSVYFRSSSDRSVCVCVRRRGSASPLTPESDGPREAGVYWVTVVTWGRMDAVSLFVNADL